MTISAEAAVLNAAIERDYAEVTRLISDRKTWSLEGIWRFKRHCEQLTSFLHSEYFRLLEEET